jgi:hypothetical protein
VPKLPAPTETDLSKPKSGDRNVSKIPEVIV